MLNHEDIIRLAKEMLVKQGYVRNHLVAFKENNIMYFPVVYGNDEEKDKYLLAARQFITQLSVDRYWQITEAWLSTDINKRPKDDPNHIEILMVNEYNKELTGKQTIIRFHKENEKIVFESEETIKPDQCANRFNFFVEDAMEERVTAIRLDKAMENMPQAKVDEFKEHLKQKVGIELTDDEARKHIRNFFKKQVLGE